MSSESHRAEAAAAALASVLRGVPLPEQSETLACVLEALAQRLRMAARVQTPATKVEGAIWSIDPTRGHADRWGDVWAKWLPTLPDAAERHGVAYSTSWEGVHLTGRREALIALGVVGASDFPGEPGRNRSMMSFGCDGRQRFRGASKRIGAAMIIAKRGGRYRVTLVAPEGVRAEWRAHQKQEREREREAQARYWHEPDCERVQSAAVLGQFDGPSRPALRLVHSDPSHMS